MDALKYRLLQIIEKLGITKSQFEKKVGFSNGFVDKSGDNTRKSSLDKISIAYPNININWLMTGEGEMLKKSSDAQKTVAEVPESDALIYTVPLLPVSAQGGSFNDFVESSFACH